MGKTIRGSRFMNIFRRRRYWLEWKSIDGKSGTVISRNLTPYEISCKIQDMLIEYGPIMVIQIGSMDSVWSTGKVE